MCLGAVAKLNCVFIKWKEYDNASDIKELCVQLRSRLWEFCLHPLKLFSESSHTAVLLELFCRNYLSLLSIYWYLFLDGNLTFRISLLKFFAAVRSGRLLPHVAPFNLLHGDILPVWVWASYGKLGREKNIGWGACAAALVVHSPRQLWRWRYIFQSP